MNYGSFFRLNQSVSKLEDGVAIYDYIDLPAYFTSSEDNRMSPKYPISVIVTSSSVCFRLHYNSFKIEEQEKQNSKDYPKYIYNIEDIDNAGKNYVKTGDRIKSAHMEEIILELPCVNDGSDILSSIIKQIYKSKFPLADTENENETNSGGRFLKQIITYRYSAKNRPNGIEGDLYETMQKTVDQMPTYSSLWLMDLSHGMDGDKHYDLVDDKNNVIGFLRKLLLDFMFDLNHSDVFQNSSNYQRMISGLMSNFFFSALIHKCEYYYYREITRRAIKDCNLNDYNAKLNISNLYAENLFRAESVWVNDIMSPMAEKYFESQGRNDEKKKDVLLGLIASRINNIWKNASIGEHSEFHSWPSWFADSEEEMRRVCFKTKDGHGNLHICNSDTLVECLDLERRDDKIAKEMVRLRDRERDLTSMWFFSRYDFNDTLHLHFFRYSNHFICLVLIALLLYFFYTGDLRDIKHFIINKGIYLLVLVFCSFPIVGKLIMNACYECNDINWGKLVRARNRLVWKRLFNITFCFVFCGALFYYLINEEWINLLVGVSFFIIYIISLPWLRMPRIDFVSKLHLFLPRPVAAITFAWLTMSMGFDIYVSFFDALPSRNYEFFVSVVVLLFVMYVINRIMPECSSLRKLHRSIELLIISYAISLCVGIVVVNFLGEKFLERGGFINDYYNEYVDVVRSDNKLLYDSGRIMQSKLPPLDSLKNDSEKIDYLVKHSERDSCESFRRQVGNLRNIYHSVKVNGKIQTIDNHSYPLAEWYPIFGIKVFIMRDFLIMFSFMSMFIGLFIQLIILGDSNKQMTEL